MDAIILLYDVFFFFFLMFVVFSVVAVDVVAAAAVVEGGDGDGGGEILLLREVEVEVERDGDDTGWQTTSASAAEEDFPSDFFKSSRKHFEQHPPVASEPKNPHPFLQRVGTVDGGACVACCCSLFSVLMTDCDVMVYLWVVVVCVCD